MSSSSHPSPNQDPHEALQRLLALKRHETPPPGFFDRLPSQIMSRLDERQESVWERLWSQLTSHPWFQPAMACSCTAAVICLFTLAFLNTDKATQSPAEANILAPATLHHSLSNNASLDRPAASPAPLHE